MKRYCFVIELKPEHVEEYCSIHKNPWQEILEEIKKAGAQELLIWNYRNLSIVYYECEDIDELYRKLGETEASKKWNAAVGPWLADAPVLDGSDSVGYLEKIFDLNQQLAGCLESF